MVIVQAAGRRLGTIRGTAGTIPGITIRGGTGTIRSITAHGIMAGVIPTITLHGIRPVITAVISPIVPPRHQDVV